MGKPFKKVDTMHKVRTEEKDQIEEAQISPYIPANWFTERGAFKKMKQLENKGLPSFYNWRFLTLTVDPKKFKSNESAYNYIKPRFRFFIRNLKKAFGLDDLQYCWKLEFQENGNPHWHMLINVKQSMCLKTIYDLWGYGSINIKRCTDKKLPYAFKYISKDQKELPNWFLKLSRPRVFQSSGIFPSEDKNDPVVATNKIEQLPDQPEKKKENLGERLERYSKTIIVSMQTKFGFFPTLLINTKQNFNDFFLNMHNALGTYLRYESPQRVFVPLQYIQYIK